jgi:WD40 repeat protein
MYFVGVRASGSGIDIWDYNSKEHLATLMVGCCWTDSTFNCDNGLLAATTYDCDVVSVFNISNEDKRVGLYELEMPDDVQFSSRVLFTSSGEHIIVGWHEKLAVYDANSWRLLEVVEPHEEGDYIREIRQFGDRLLTASDSGILVEWSTHLDRFRSVQTGEPFYQLCVNHVGDVIALSVDRGIRILDGTTLQQATTFGGDIICDFLQFNTTGDRLLGSWFDVDRTVGVFDVLTGSLQFKHILANNGVCYSLDSSYIFGSSAKGCISCWDAETGLEVESPFQLTDINARNTTYHYLCVVGSATVVLM